MYTRILLSTALLAFAPLALASESTRAIDALAQDTGLSHNDICMLLGPSSSNLRYPTSYDRVLDKFIRAVGYSEYERLVNHEFTPQHHDRQMHARNITS